MQQAPGPSCGNFRAYRRRIPTDPEMWNMDSVKTAVIQLLREMSQSKLAKICPLKQSLLSTIVNNKFSGKLGAEKCKEFGRWFMQYRQSSPAMASTFLDEDKPPQDGRMTFHSSTELPRMREWYRQCPHPTNLQLQDFANQLNCESLRLRNKPKVTLNSLKNWWKNERQRERRIKRHASGGGDEDSNPGVSASGATGASSSSASSSSVPCPVPAKVPATSPCAHHHHCHQSSTPSATSPPPLPSHPQPPRSPLSSFPRQHDRPQHIAHDCGARAAAAAAMMPLRHFHHLHHHHHPRFVHSSNSGVVPAPSSPGDLVVALSTTSPS